MWPNFVSCDLGSRVSAHVRLFRIVAGTTVRETDLRVSRSNVSCVIRLSVNLTPIMHKGRGLHIGCLVRSNALAVMFLKEEESCIGHFSSCHFLLLCFSAVIYVSSLCVSAHFSKSFTAHLWDQVLKFTPHPQAAVTSETPAAILLPFV